MSSYAYAAKAAATVPDTAPEDWPADWDFPPSPPSSEAYPPGFEGPSADAVFTCIGPEDEEMGVAVSTNLVWDFVRTVNGVEIEAESFEVFLDGVRVAETSLYSYPTTLEIGDHEWRIVAKKGHEHWVGPVWEFQTELALTATATAESSAIATAWDAAVFCSGTATASSSTELAYADHYTAPVAPTGVSASWGAKFIMDPLYKINLTWTDNASDENGFEEQDSNDGINWPGAPYVYTYDTESAEAGLGAGYAGTSNWYFRIRAYKTVDGVTTYSTWAVSPMLAACGPW